MLLLHVKKHSSVNVNVIPCSINDFKLAEDRPLDTSMNSDKLVKAIGIKLNDMETVCEKIVKKKFRKVHVRRTP